VKRLVKLGEKIGSYSDKYGLKLSHRPSTELPDIKELPNESFFYQKMLFMGVLKEHKREGIPLHRCDICFAKGKYNVFRNVKQWYVHMRKEHPRGN
jgi:hypothetical protein